MDKVLIQSGLSDQHQEHFVRKTKEKSSLLKKMILAGYSMEKPYFMEKTIISRQ